MSRFKPEVRIVIDNQEFYNDFSESLIIGPDLDEEMDKMAGLIGWAGAILAAIKEESLKEEADYRSWRASYAKDTLEKEPKLAEWKVRVMIESTKEYLRFKHDLASLTKAEVMMTSVLSAFKHKSELLRSRGAINRAELNAIGQHTKSEG